MSQWDFTLEATTCARILIPGLWGLDCGLEWEGVLPRLGDLKKVSKMFGRSIANVSQLWSVYNIHKYPEGFLKIQKFFIIK